MIYHVLREVNVVVHYLASKLHHSLQGLVFYDNPTKECNFFLWFDYVGTLFP